MAEEEHKPPEGGKGKGAKGLFKDKKNWLILGGIVLIGIVFVAIRSANKNAGTGNAGTATTGAGPAVNPATGYLYGSPADLAAQGASGTVTGPPGPQGPPGPAGPPGKTGAPGGTPKPKPKPKPKPVHHPKPGPGHPNSGYHTVLPGENLTEIAAKYGGGSWQNLYHLNRHTIGSNPNLIHPGMRLKL